MHYSIIAAPIALAAAVSAGEYATSWTTEVVSTLTTYCPSATSLSINGKIHTVTEATTLTISDCPCTKTYPVALSSTPVIVVPSFTPVAPIVVSNSSNPAVILSTAPAIILSTAPAVILSTAPAVPVVPLSSAVPVAPYPISNSTTPVPVGTASAGTVAPSAPSASLGSGTVTIPSAKPTFTGAASRMGASSVSLITLFGLAVYIL